MRLRSVVAVTLVGIVWWWWSLEIASSLSSICFACLDLVVGAAAVHVARSSFTIAAVLVVSVVRWQWWWRCRRGVVVVVVVIETTAIAISGTITIAVVEFASATGIVGIHGAAAAAAAVVVDSIIVISARIDTAVATVVKTGIVALRSHRRRWRWRSRLTIAQSRRRANAAVTTAAVVGPRRSGRVVAHSWHSAPIIVEMRRDRAIESRRTIALRARRCRGGGGRGGRC